MATLNPGTVSRVLWHFTGGPLWDSKLARQTDVPKPADDAFRACVEILRSGELRLGSYRELVRVLIPAEVRKDRRGRPVNVPERSIKVESYPVNCLADIPIFHLGYHANRYGRFAIGFHRDCAVEAGFNPVLYSVQSSAVAHVLYSMFSTLKNSDPSGVTLGAEELESRLAELGDDELYSSCASDASTLEMEIEEVTENLRRVLAFTKTFSQEEFSTIYCEREWRSLMPFRFKPEDVAMITVPRDHGGRRYLDELLALIEELRIPRGTPVIAWEDIHEY